MKNVHNNTFWVLIALALSPTLWSSTHLIHSNAETGDGTLHQKIIQANAGDTLLFDTILDGVPIYLTSSNDLLIDKNLTIIGNGIDNSLIDANYDGRIFVVQSNAILELQNMSLLNANVLDTNANGGAILNNGELYLKNCKIENCQAFNGGAIFNTGIYHLDQSSLYSNTATLYGGAIYDEAFSQTETPFIQACHFAGNSAGNDGGAMYNDGWGGDSSPLVFNTVFSGNYAQDDGGAIYANGSYGVSSPVYINCTFGGNKAENTGDVLFAYGHLGVSQTKFFNCIIWNNIATTDSVFAIHAAEIELSYCLLKDNLCPSITDCENGMIYNQNPLFTTEIEETAPTLQGKFQLQANSPAINAGSNDILEAYNLLENDEDENENNLNRIVEGIVDLGAYEFQDATSPIYELSSVELKVFLEGPFDETSGAMRTDLLTHHLLPNHHPYNNAPFFCPTTDTLTTLPNQMVDWILVEVRTDSMNSTRVEQKAALLLSDGRITDLDGISPIQFNLEKGGDYYFVIRHRNHLDIMTATAISQSTTMSYDFTMSMEMAYGNFQLKEIGGYMAMYSGDITQDLVIQNTDFGAWSILPAQLFMYSQADLNLDGAVQTTDFDIWKNTQSKLTPTELAY